jgi:hypothetical protein
MAEARSTAQQRIAMPKAMMVEGFVFCLCTDDFTSSSFLLLLFLLMLYGEKRFLFVNFEPLSDTFYSTKQLDSNPDRIN